MATATHFINRYGALLVFPIRNAPQPFSLWSCLYGNAKMRWEWDEAGDDRVATLWHLRTKLSTSGKVVYTKWYQNRATFFSIPAFEAVLKLLVPSTAEELALSKEARRVLDVLLDDSPLTPKEIRVLCEYEGKEGRYLFEKVIKELWSTCLIVGFGEKDAGGYPSLLIGAVKNLFEEQWENSRRLSSEDALDQIKRLLAKQPTMLDYLMKRIRV